MNVNHLCYGWAFSVSIYILQEINLVSLNNGLTLLFAMWVVTRYLF